MIWGISLVLLSVLAVPSLLLSKKPNAKELLEKIEPYQGWIGMIFCFLGIWGIISSVLTTGWLSYWPILWITYLIGNIVTAALGFMLGYGLINKYILSKNEEAKTTIEEMRTKIAPKQGKLGLIGLVLGAWMIVSSFLFGIV